MSTARLNGNHALLAERLRFDLDARLLASVAELESDGPQLSREDQRALAASLTHRWLAELAAERAAEGVAPLDAPERGASGPRGLGHLVRRGGPAASPG